MTVRVIIRSPALTDAVVSRVYCVPLVRELVLPVAVSAGDRAW
jgi:hypothetical protein